MGKKGAGIETSGLSGRSESELRNASVIIVQNIADPYIRSVVRGMDSQFLLMAEGFIVKKVTVLVRTFLNFRITPEVFESHLKDIHNLVATNRVSRV